MNQSKVLFVDDEENVLAAMTRQLRKTFQVATAGSGTEALETLERLGPFAVVVSDLRMPGMDGVALLSAVRKKHPEVVRVMLSGDADLGTAIEAVNSGRIFRFLTKPCSLNALVTTLTLAIRQYELLASEKELLDKTVKGSLSMLSELLSLANPRAFSSGYRIKDLVSSLAVRLGLKPLWQYEVAALVSQVGCIAIPDDILEKAYTGARMSAEEAEMFRDHPRVGARLVGRIPRLEKVADIIAHQLKDYRDEETHTDLPEDIRLGSQLLSAALAYDRLILEGVLHDEAVKRLYGCRGCYNPDILAQLEALDAPRASSRTIVRLQFDELVPGMVAAEDIRAQNGALIIGKGQEITWPVLQGLQNFLKHIGIQGPISVWSAP